MLPNPLSNFSTTYRIILGCVAKHPNQLNRTGLARLLVGSKSCHLQGLEDSSFFGRLRGHKRKGVGEDVEILIQQGYLVADSEGKVGLSEGLEDGIRVDVMSGEAVWVKEEGVSHRAILQNEHEVRLR